ncbi:hypothetical protein JCM10213_006299 [Rhodosporidiobolus nylandii]
MAHESPNVSLWTRLNHPHYHANALLCLPFPALLLVSAPSGNNSLLTAALVSAPLLIAFSVAARNKATELESLCESITFQLRLFNLFGLVFTRGQLGLGKRWVAAYVLAWLLVSFFLPQPGYLGPSSMKELTTEEFDAKVLLIRPARSAAAAFASAPLDGARIVELSDEQAEEVEELELGSKDTYNLVLFHVDFSRKSRELQMTLARLSAIYASPSLTFSLLDPEIAATTFYDLNLSVSPTSLDLPLLRLYRGGKVVHQAPLSEEHARARRREEKLRVRREARGKKRAERAAKRRRQGGQSESESGSDTDSEDEREVAQQVAMARYGWDRSAEGIVREFKLRERSGLFPPESKE